MAKSGIDIQPTFPPTVKLQEASRFKIFLSVIVISFAFLLAKPLSFISPQPKIPWPKAETSATDDDESNLPLIGTLTIVTGANSGVGYSIAKAQFQKGSTVILACRNKGRGEKAYKSILSESNLSSWGDSSSFHKRLQLFNLDTSSLESVRGFVQQWKKQHPNGKVDYLFLNAGMAQKPENVNRFTSDGLEYLYATNFLGHFLLTGLLSPSFSHKARIILTSSHGAITGKFDPNLTLKGPGKPKSEKDLEQYQLEKDFHVTQLPTNLALVNKLIDVNFLQWYGQTKAMQIVFSNILQQKFDQSDFKNRQRFSASFHPGFVASNIFKSFLRDDQTTLTSIADWIVQFFGIKPDEGCKTGLWLAHTFDARPGGVYDLDYELALPWFKDVNEDLLNRLWTRWNNDANLLENDWKF